MTTAATGALLVAAVAVACVTWSGGAAPGRSMLLEEELGAYDPASKQQELAIIQRALSDEEHGTTPPRVLAEEREEAEQEQLEQKRQAHGGALRASAKRSAMSSTKSDVNKSAVAKSVPAAHKATHASVTPAAKTAKPAAPSHPPARAPLPEVQKPESKAAPKVADLEQKGAAGGGVAWQLKQRQIKREYSKLISLEQLQTMHKVTQLKDTIMKQVVHVLQEGKDKVASLQSKEKAAETVVKYDQKQEDLKHQLRQVQERAATKAEALQRKLAAVDALAKKYGANPSETLAAPKKSETAAQEHYKGENASKQKQMRDKVKAAAYAKSDEDEDTMEKQLEESLDREVLSMDKHPLVKKEAEKMEKHALKAASSAEAAKAGAQQAGAQRLASGASKAPTEPQLAPHGGALGKTAAEVPVVQGAKTAVETSKTTLVKPAVTVVKAASPGAGASSKASAPARPDDKEARKQHVSASSSRRSSQPWVHDDSPAAQIMKEIVAKDHTSSPLTFSDAAAESQRASAPAKASSAASSAHQGKDRDEGGAHAQHASAAVKDADAVPAKGGKATWAQDLKWAVAHGMPAKLAYDTSKTVQVRKIIARMKAKAVITKLEDSIKHDESFVSTVEKKAEKAAGQ